MFHFLNFTPFNTINLSQIFPVITKKANDASVVYFPSLRQKADSGIEIYSTFVYDIGEVEVRFLESTKPDKYLLKNDMPEGLTAEKLYEISLENLRNYYRNTVVETLWLVDREEVVEVSLDFQHLRKCIYRAFCQTVPLTALSQFLEERKQLPKQEECAETPTASQIVDLQLKDVPLGILYHLFPEQFATPALQALQAKRKDMPFEDFRNEVYDCLQKELSDSYQLAVSKIAAYLMDIQKPTEAEKRLAIEQQVEKIPLAELYKYFPDVFEEPRLLVLRAGIGSLFTKVIETKERLYNVHNVWNLPDKHFFLLPEVSDLLLLSASFIGEGLLFGGIDSCFIDLITGAGKIDETIEKYLEEILRYCKIPDTVWDNTHLLFYLETSIFTLCPTDYEYDGVFFMNLTADSTNQPGDLPRQSRPAFLLNLEEHQITVLCYNERFRICDNCNVFFKIGLHRVSCDDCACCPALANAGFC